MGVLDSVDETAVVAISDAAAVAVAVDVAVDVDVAAAVAVAVSVSVTLLSLAVLCAGGLARTMGCMVDSRCVLNMSSSSSASSSPIALSSPTLPVVGNSSIYAFSAPSLSDDSTSSSSCATNVSTSSSEWVEGSSPGACVVVEVPSRVDVNVAVDGAAVALRGRRGNGRVGGCNAAVVPVAGCADSGVFMMYLKVGAS